MTQLGTRSRARFLFWIERPLHVPMLEPLWDYVSAHKLGESAFATFLEPKNGLGLDWSMLRGLEAKGWFHANDPQAFRPDLTFVADHNYQHVEGLGRIVNVGHGTLSKGLYFLPGGLSRRENLADLLCVPGTLHKTILSKAVHKPVTVCGMPKLDKCFGEPVHRLERLRQWGLDPARKTLLFAPTFNEELSLLPHLDKPLRDYIPQEWNLIVKLHGATSPVFLDRIFKNAKNDPRMMIATAEDVSVFFPVADLLLSDLSSVIFEFSIMDKPMLLFDSPWQKRYPHYSPSHLEYRCRDIGFRFSDVSRIPILIPEALARHEKKLPRQRQLSRQIVSVRDGTSARRVIEASFKLLDQKPEVTVLDAWPASLSSIQTPFVFFCDPNWSLSPLGLKALLNHLKTTPQAGAVSPMISENNALSPIAQRQFGTQLGYVLPGENLPVKNISELCFAARTESLKGEPRSRKKWKSLLALDAAAFPASEGATKLLPWKILPPSNQSVFMHFVSLPWKNTPRNFLTLVFRRIRQGIKPRTPDKETQFLCDLGSAFEKIGDWKRALFHFQKANRLKRTPQRKVEARLFFHLGCCHHQLKNLKTAALCFKRCLELEPEHQKAREYLGL